MIVAALALAGCGGSPAGSAGGNAPVPMSTPTPMPTPAPTPTPAANTTPVVFDAGPPALNVGVGAYTAFNVPFVTITICAPGSTTNCQTIDHVTLDTGSVGLRIIQPVLKASLLAALPVEKSASGNGVGECYQYVNSYAFGSVRQADFQIAGEKVRSIAFQTIGDSGAFAKVPAECSAGGGSPIATVQDFGANAIIGVGTTPTDCGSICEVAGGQSAAIYYDCPATGCVKIIGRAATTAAPFEQLPNPVAAFASDNNGTVITLPAVVPGGAAGLTGSVTFGIGTQADNMLGTANVLPLTTSNSTRGPGLLTATYKGKSLTQSFLDTGSADYFFIDTSLLACTAAGLDTFYCPASPLMLSPKLVATNGAAANAAFTLYNPNNLAATALVAPGLGINPALVKPVLPFGDSFDFGVPFFFGRTVYTAIEGTQAGGVSGPYVAW